MQILTQNKEKFPLQGNFSPIFGNFVRFCGDFFALFAKMRSKNHKKTCIYRLFR